MEARSKSRMRVAAALCMWGVLFAAPMVARAERQTLRVAAAADLGKALPRIAVGFERRTGVHVNCVFGSTGLLTKQVENGAPFDLILSADEPHIAELEKGGYLVQGSRRLYAIGRLVVWVKPGARAPREMRDLAAPGIRRIAVANPEHAPYGAAAVEALKKAGVWREVSPKLVYGENVQQALRYAESGAADAAMISFALVAGAAGTAVPVPPTLYAPIRQAMGVLRSSKNAAAAEQFAAFVAGPEGRDVLRRFGFTLPAMKAR